jgi:hypothetical protein
VVAATTSQLDRLGSLARLSRTGRATRDGLDATLDTSHAAVIDAAGTVAAAEHRVDRLAGEQTAHDRFDTSESWRHDAITTALDRLDAHWTDVALACVRADQTLAYGIDPLRLAHDRLAGQLAAIHATLPADRDPERRAARTDVTTAIAQRHDAERQLAAATARHTELTTRRWPRRDSAAIGGAADDVDRARTTLDRAEVTQTAARARLVDLDAHQKSRQQALELTAPERRRLTADVELVDDAFDRTRPQRVRDLAQRPSPWHVELLGPAPASPAARAVWLHSAHRIEAHLDRQPGHGPVWRQLCHDLADTAQLCAVAEHYLRLDGDAEHVSQWAHIADIAVELHDDLIAQRELVERRTTDRGIGLELGL